MAPKVKAQKMSVSTFLADESLGSWADEMEDMPLPSTQPLTSTFSRRPAGDSAFGSGSGSGGFERERGGYAVREPLDLPTQPPYTCHVGNLSFESTDADISEFFAGCGVTNVRLVEDKLTKAPKGFGYVEFETVEGLQKALDLSGSSFQGRSIRTSVAEPPKESRLEGKDLDWSRRGPLPELPQRRVPERSNFGRGIDAGSDAGSDRGGRRSNFESDGKPRDFNNWERKGPLSPSAGGPPREGGREHSNDGPSSSFRRNEAAWGEGRTQDEGSRPPRPEHVRPEPTPTAADMDNQWRARMRPDETPKEPISPVSPLCHPCQNPTPTSASSDSKASPFGAARPIDTATRERQVEERRQLAIRQKQEAAEKAKAEKAEKFAEKQKQLKESAPAVDHNGKDVLETPKGGGNFEILQRAGEDGELTAGKETEETAAAAPVEAKKPSANGWRAPAPEAGAGGDDEGWSTVSVNKRNNRRGQTGRGFA
ncbi:Translation initiation factor 4B [Penicillium digitatum Pd1]|uniref:Translation initiation factor 4B n=1 Tax=Penicillium digitatum (strain Pd1 / CECT 20795) TaxID=1170230 RepID=K9G2A8_PEND1|nr:Translation initiation factor 4B [Penicillium digitatum Pd1]EKV16145.1 Translation initiation factor 4B [Penicillium digitatum Pd1]